MDEEKVNEYMDSLHKIWSEGGVALVMKEMPRYLQRAIDYGKIQQGEKMTEEIRELHGKVKDVDVLSEMLYEKGVEKAELRCERCGYVSVVLPKNVYRPK